MPSNSEATAARARPLRARAVRAWAALPLAGVLACSSAAAGPGPTRLAPPSPPAASASAAAANADGYELPVRMGGMNASFPFQPPAAVAADTRLARLSHRQYQRTVQDLLGL